VCYRGMNLDGRRASDLAQGQRTRLGAMAQRSGRQSSRQNEYVAVCKKVDGSEVAGYCGPNGS
jgi:hypothetical protein